ncbi:hypothetical protein CF319_g4803 [Tilletia indica]|nr:hypothetical protein CF319_g4803 [Tilletia indica]
MSRKKKGKQRQIEASRAVESGEEGSQGKVEVLPPDKSSDRGQELRSDEVTVKTAGKSVQTVVKVDDGKATERFRPIHGNFRNYYAIRGRSSGSATGENLTDKIWTPSTSAVVLDTNVRDDIDPRVRHLLNWTAAVPSSNKMPYDRILDIGSNSGQVTLELAEALEYIYGRAPSCVLGVDIDDELTQQARHALERVRSDHAEPHRKRRRMDSLALPIPVQEHSISIFQPRKVKAKMAAIQKSTVANGLASAEPLPTSSSNLQARNNYAANITFKTADWVKEGPGYLNIDPTSKSATEAQGWDLILGLSLTKWVHINNGTQGMLRLFGRIAASLKYLAASASVSPSTSTATSFLGRSGGGGIFLLEPQAWSSYQTARSQGADVRARIRALRSAAPLEPRCISIKKGKRKQKRKRTEEEEEVLQTDNVPALGGDGTGHHTATEEYGYPPLTPDDFPFILSVIFGLEGPIDLGHSQGAGFRRPLQIYIQPDFAKLPVKRANEYRRAREAAIQGDLVLSWAPRQFK